MSHAQGEPQMRMPAGQRPGGSAGATGPANGTALELGQQKSFLPDAQSAHTISYRASHYVRVAVGMTFVAPRLRSALGLIVPVTVLGASVIGCGSSHRENDRAGPVPARQVVVVAPVLNLSGTTDFDPLRFTDIVASEFLSFSTVSVVPVNLTLAALAKQGKAWVEAPEDAVELARRLGADATVVTAVTEYCPYDPPVIGMVMQWYALSGRDAAPRLDPVAASRRSTDLTDVKLSAQQEYAPRFQLQRVFDASHDQVLKDIQDYARRRGGHQSPHGFRKHVKSQELYIRYCCWSLIRSMLALSRHGESGVMLTEAEP